MMCKIVKDEKLMYQIFMKLTKSKKMFRFYIIIIINNNNNINI